MALQQELANKRKKVELILHQLNSLPTLPAVAARLLQITVRSNTQAAEVVQLIESDPSLASKIIALVTRAGTGVNRRMASLSKAVVLLGFDAVRNAVLSIKVFEALGGGDHDPSHSFDRIGFWKHSLATACAGKLLSRHIDANIDPEEAFVCGLLHDIGKLALDVCLPKSYARIVQITEESLGNIAEVEQKLLGIDHVIAGKRLAEKWQLPESITETIWLHHQPPESLPGNIRHQSLVKMIYLADLLAREQRIGYSGNHSMEVHSESVGQSLGCPVTVLDEIARDLRAAISERAELLGLNDLDPDQLYHEALGDANTELSKLNVRLQVQNERLHLRSEYFELISTLNDTLRTNQTVAEVCSHAARLWRRHASGSACAVYAVSPDESLLEGAAASAAQDEPTTFLVDRGEDIAAAAWQEMMGEFSAGFSLSRAGLSHEWFFERVSDELDMAGTLVAPLRTGDTLVGGLLWEPVDRPAGSYTPQQKEIQAFAASVALALRQAQEHEKQLRLCEELEQSNRSLLRSQQELLRNRALASVGEMACGAAHEMNNPLAVVVGRSQLLASSEPDEKRKGMLEAISHQGQEISKIISELMEVAKPSVPKPNQVSAPELVKGAQEDCQELAQERQIVWQSEFEPELPEVFVDGGQIRGVLTELMKNAIESYQNGGGTVRVVGRYDELDNEVVLEVIDQGCGMDEQTLKKVFDPFFSARPAGRGRGLGLSRSLRHTETNGGRLRLIPNPTAGGITAKLWLPTVRKLAEVELAI